jgi:nucleotide-binding universal stress UspA family protein
LRKAGHQELADRIASELIGRNVLPGRWTFKVVEDYDDLYYEPFVALEREARQQLADGKRHLQEAQLKRKRATPGRSGHEMDAGELEG